jgi:hypothetical protein
MADGYRCLHSAGFHLCVFNASIENGTLLCGLIKLPGNLNEIPIKLKDLDTGQPVCRVKIPEEYHAKYAPIWLRSRRDNIEFEVTPP